MKRYSKTAAQQCRFYEVDNIFEYMVETYINGNHSTLRRLYHELNKEARKDFIGFLLLALSAGDIRSFASEKGDSDSILAVLFPDGKAIGQPYTRNRTDIRMVRVFSEDEAYGIFRRLCGKEYIFPVSDGKYHYHACLLAKPYTGYLLYSFHVKPDTYEVGVIYVHSPELRKLGIKELHLVKAIKIKK